MSGKFFRGVFFTGFFMGFAAIGYLLLRQVQHVAQPRLRGNPDKRVFHNAGCRYYPVGGNIVEFSDEETAAAEGYRPCKICFP